MRSGHSFQVPGSCQHLNCSVYGAPSVRVQTCECIVHLEDCLSSSFTSAILYLKEESVSLGNMSNRKQHVCLRTFEQMRVIANWHYKEKLYEQATTIYFNCIASIIQSHLVDYQDFRKGGWREISILMARKSPPMFNEQASLIYLNIAQTLLVRQNDARYKQYFGLGAAEVNYRNSKIIGCCDLFERLHKHLIFIVLDDSADAITLAKSVHDR